MITCGMGDLVAPSFCGIILERFGLPQAGPTDSTISVNLLLQFDPTTSHGRWWKPIAMIGFGNLTLTALTVGCSWPAVTILSTGTRSGQGRSGPSLQFGVPLRGPISAHSTVRRRRMVYPAIAWKRPQPSVGPFARKRATAYRDGYTSFLAPRASSSAPIPGCLQGHTCGISTEGCVRVSPVNHLHLASTS